MRFAVGDLVVDTERLTVERDSDTLQVQPQVFDVMSHLVLNRDRVVTKEELLDEVWGDRFVSESALSSRIKSVRQMLGDDGVRQAVIKTFHGRGFRWVADIDVLDVASAAEPSTEGRTAVGSAMTPPPGLTTETVGREDLIQEVTDALATRRLVTLIGSPGIGKTRIALESVRRLDDEERQDREQRQIAFVELHAATSRLDILRLVRQAVGIDPDRGVQGSIESSDDDLGRRLIERLADASIVLVIDNCEHVADHVAGFVRGLLPVAPSVTILATSRRPLWVDGEHLVIVGPLDQPRDPSWAGLGDSPAGRLFLDRSSAAGVVWRRGDDEAAAVGELCRRLDGVPLAIELAAARTRWMPLERLVDDLAGVSPEWGSGAQPLTASLRSSRALLDEPAQAAFDALSIFAGTFSLDAALRVIAAIEPQADPVAVFEQLVDHSLIEVSDLTLGRYRMLAPVRQFAASGEPRTDAVTPALLAFFANLVEETWPSDSSTPTSPWDALDADMSDVLILLGRAATTEPTGCRRVVGSLGRWWWMTDSTQECLALCERLGEPVEDDPAAGARYLWTWCMCESSLWQPHRQRAQRAHELALETEQWSVAASALSLVVAGDMVWADIETVQAAWDDIESLYRRAGDIAGEAWARVRVLGHAQACAGRTADAADSFRTAIRLYERIGDQVGIAVAAVRFARAAIWEASDPDLADEALALLPSIAEQRHDRATSLPRDLQAEAVWYAGRVAEARGDVDVALERHQAALAISEAHIPGSIVSNTLRVHLAVALRRAGRYAESASHLHEAVEVAVRSLATVRPAHPMWVIESAAGLLAEVGRDKDAATLFGAAEAGRERTDAVMPTWDRPGYDRDVALIADSATTAAAWSTGRGLDLDQACEIALAACAGMTTGA